MNGLADFHFLRPEWLLGLLPVALASLLLVRQRLEHGRWREAIDPELAQWLVEGSWSRGARLGLLGALIAWSLALLALAGPTTERRPQAVSRADDAMVVVLDLSLSMYAEDLAPSRLVRARLKIADVLAERRDGQTGLVVYAGDAHVVVPLTDDVRTIRNLLPSLEPGVMPVLGSRTAHALELAVRLLDEAEAAQGRILLITDEVIDLGDARGALSPRYPLSVLGVGTPEGAPIPLAGIGRNGVLEAEGRTVVARLDEAPLQALARAGGGRFARFRTDGDDLSALLDPTASELAGEEERAFDLWIDLGPWLVLALLPIAALAFRRGLVACALLALLLSAPEPAMAASWFSTPDQEAYRALREGRSEAAAEQFTDPLWRATALYRAEDYDAAASSFAVAPSDDELSQTESLYNEGNRPGPRHEARAGAQQPSLRYSNGIPHTPTHATTSTSLNASSTPSDKRQRTNRAHSRTTRIRRTTATPKPPSATTAASPKTAARRKMRSPATARTVNSSPANRRRRTAKPRKPATRTRRIRNCSRSVRGNRNRPWSSGCAASRTSRVHCCGASSATKQTAATARVCAERHRMHSHGDGPAHAARPARDHPGPRPGRLRRERRPSGDRRERRRRPRTAP